MKDSLKSMRLLNLCKKKLLNYKNKTLNWKLNKIQKIMN